MSRCVTCHQDIPTIEASLHEEKGHVVERQLDQDYFVMIELDADERGELPQ